MSEEHLSEARRRLMDFAVRAVSAARTASAATSATAARAAATANAAAAKAKAAAAAATAGRAAAAAATAGRAVASMTTDGQAIAVTTDGQAAGRACDADDADSPNPRDETIARLEQELETERARTEELGAAVKAFEFKQEILERSYAKQLADARAAGEAATRELSELKTLLADTTQELKRVTAIKDRLRDMFAFDGRRVPPELRDEQPGDEDTIARLLAIANAMPERNASAGEAPEAPEARPQSEPEAGDLLSPELVFDSNDESEEDEEGGPRNEPNAVRG